MCYSCNITPKIQLPIGLRNQLFRDNNYFEYVHLLNTAYDSSRSEDLANFLMAGHFDSKFCASEHGQIAFKLLEHKGDSFFYKSLALLNKTDLHNIESCLSFYLILQEPEQVYEYIHKYHNSFEYLGLVDYFQ